MNSFRLLSRTRQSTEYTCGPTALQAVLQYWGADVSESKLAKLAKTNSKVGTYPENLVRSATALGFDAEAKENLTLDEVQAYTAKGDPMIALGQVWRSQKSSTSVANEWGTGHYIVVLGVDRENVYFQDPYIRMSKAFVSRPMFEAHWHHAMSGSLATSRALRHLGIFVKGKRKRSVTKPALTPKALVPDFLKLGSVDVILLTFNESLYPYEFLTEVQEIWDAGSVRPNAFILMRKEKDGTLSALEGGRVEESNDLAATNSLLTAIASRAVAGKRLTSSAMASAAKSAGHGDFGITASEMSKLGERLKKGHSAIIIVVENVWERKLREIAHKYRGGLSRQILVDSATLAGVAKRIGTSSRRASRRTLGRTQPKIRVAAVT